MKCFILSRQSSNDGDNSLSLEKQEEECLKCCNKENIKVVETFQEPGISGRLYPEGFEEVSKTDFIYTSFIKGTDKEGVFRPGLGKILKRLNEVDFICVYDVTRLMRPLNGSFLQNIIIQHLIQNKVKVLSVKEGIIDYNNFQDSLFSSLTSQINSEQLLIQRQKAIDAKRRSRDKGEFANGIYHMFGYTYLNKTLGFEIEPNGASMIKFIVEEFVEKNTRPAEIAREIVKRWPMFLNTTRLQHPHVMLSQACNPIYAGYCFNTEEQLIPFKTIRGKELYSLETYFKFKKKLDDRKLSKTRASKGFYPLSGKIYCTCGNTMYALGSTCLDGVRLMKYVCSSYRTLEGGKGCKSNIQISYDTLEGLSLHSCIKPLLAAELLNRMEMTLKNGTSQLDIQNVEIKLQSLVEKEKKITQLYLNDSLSNDTYEETIKGIRADKKKYESLKNELLAPKNEITIETQLDVLMKIFNREISDDEFSDLCSNFIKKIISHPDCLEITTSMGVTYVKKNLTSRGARMFNYFMSIDTVEDENGITQMTPGEVRLIWYAGKARKISYEEEQKASFVQRLGKLSIYSL